MEDTLDIERQLNRLEAKALLHGRTDAIEAEIANLGAQLEAIDVGAWEDWLMDRDRELGRAFAPLYVAGHVRTVIGLERT